VHFHFEGLSQELFQISFWLMLHPPAYIIKLQMRYKWKVGREDWLLRFFGSSRVLYYIFLCYTAQWLFQANSVRRSCFGGLHDRTLALLEQIALK
jgi:hypothetical protein